MRTTILVGIVFELATIAQTQGAEPGKVIAYYSGQGTGSETVWLLTQDCRLSYRTGEFQQNHFVFNSIQPGRYRVLGYENGARWSPPSPEFIVAPGATVTVDVHVSPATCGDLDDPKSCWPPAGTPVAARVLNERGEPVVGAMIIAVVHGRGSIWPNTQTVSGSDGRFGYCAVSPGNITISVVHPAYRPRSQRVKVGASGYSSAQFEIRVRSR